jgi:hypothetical protein
MRDTVRDIAPRRDDARLPAGLDFRHQVARCARKVRAQQTPDRRVVSGARREEHGAIAGSRCILAFDATPFAMPPVKPVAARPFGSSDWVRRIMTI